MNNIRIEAAVCGVSVGSVYNYFDSKAALVEAATESVRRASNEENSHAYMDI